MAFLLYGIYMNIYFKIFQEYKKDKFLKVSKSNFGTFLVVGEMGVVRHLHLDIQRKISTHTYSHGITKDGSNCFIFMVLEPSEYQSFISLILDNELRNVFHKIHFIGHDVCSDFISMMITGVDKHLTFRFMDESIISDIKLREMILEVADGIDLSKDEELEYSVQSLSQKYGSRLRFSLPKSEEDQTNLDHLIPMRDHLLSYLRSIREVYLKQFNRDDELKLRLGNLSLGCESSRIKYDFSLCLMSSRGIVVDKALLKKIKMSLNGNLVDADKRMIDEHFAIEKTNQKEFSILIDEKSIESQLIKDGVARISQNGKILKKSFDFGRSSSDALRNFSKYTNDRIVSRQVIPSIIKAMGKGKTLYPNFVSFSTTGRAHSYEPNIMGIPTKGGVRECFKARSGYTFIIADYESVEMRVFAQVLLDTVGKSKLAEMYSTDTNFDPHTLLASHYLGIDYQEGLSRKMSDDEFFSNTRSQMKALNFGFMGGASLETIALSLQESFGGDIKIDKAKELANLYFSVFPEVKEYFSFVRSQLSSSMISSAFINRSRMLIGKRNFNQLLNNYVQSLASDGSLTALYNITRKGFSKMSPLYQTRPLISIHDEIVIEVKKELVVESASAIKIEMETSMEMFTPNVRSAVETRQSDVWTKHGVLI